MPNTRKILIVDDDPEMRDALTEQALAYCGFMNFEARKLDSPNTVEGYFSIFKRGVVGTYHHVSEQHLDRYLAEFDFRYNNRLDLGVSDPARSKKLLKGIVGRRLTYRSLTLPRSPSQNARKFLRWRKRQS